MCFSPFQENINSTRLIRHFQQYCSMPLQIQRFYLASSIQYDIPGGLEVLPLQHGCSAPPSGGLCIRHPSSRPQSTAEEFWTEGSAQHWKKDQTMKLLHIDRYNTSIATADFAKCCNWSPFQNISLLSQLFCTCTTRNFSPIQGSVVIIQSIQNTLILDQKGSTVYIVQHNTIDIPNNL